MCFSSRNIFVSVIFVSLSLRKIINVTLKWFSQFTETGMKLTIKIRQVFATVVVMFPEERLCILPNYLRMRMITVLILSKYWFSISQWDLSNPVLTDLTLFLTRVLVLKRQCLYLTSTGSSTEIQYTVVGLY